MTALSEQDRLARLRRWTPAAVILSGSALFFSGPALTFGFFFYFYAGERHFQPILYWFVAAGLLALSSLILILFGWKGPYRILEAGFCAAGVAALAVIGGLFS